MLPHNFAFFKAVFQISLLFLVHPHPFNATSLFLPNFHLVSYFKTISFRINKIVILLHFINGYKVYQGFVEEKQK